MNPIALRGDCFSVGQRSTRCSGPTVDPPAEVVIQALPREQPVSRSTDRSRADLTEFSRDTLSGKLPPDYPRRHENSLGNETVRTKIVLNAWTIVIGCKCYL